MKYLNLKIRAYLRTTVISDIFLPLDGLLYYHAVREKLGVQLFTIPGKLNVPDNFTIDLPLKKSESNGEWFYNCSFAKWSDRIESTSFKTKQADWLKHSDFYDGKKNIDIKRGKYKPAFIKQYYRFSNYIEWYAVGNKELIARLLNHCTHIGSSVADGWGEINKWEISEIEQDFSIRDENGSPARSIPSPTGAMPFGIRPSYWLKENMKLCEMPEIL